MTCSPPARCLQHTILPLFTLILAACFSFATTPTTYDIALGDLDGDGDLDAFFANGQSENTRPNSVWINQGGGIFQDSGQALGNSDTRSIALGDLDGDGDLDAIEGGWGLIYFNDGHGSFTRSDRNIPPADGSYTRFTALGDLDQDGDLDAFLAGCCGAGGREEIGDWVIPPASSVYLNDGEAHFSAEDPVYRQGCQSAALGDLDGDGDLDAFLACWITIQHSGTPAVVSALTGSSEQAYYGSPSEQTHSPNRVFLNAGAGQMFDSGQALGNETSLSVALGDLDGDGDLDAFVGNHGDDQVWINQGGVQGGIAGQYLPGSQWIANRSTQKIVLGDVDGDGDLDALLTIEANRGQAPELWLNEGRAAFKRSAQNLLIRGMQHYTLSDLDDDGDLDIFAGSFTDGYGIWLNDGVGNYER